MGKKSRVRFSIELCWDVCARRRNKRSWMGLVYWVFRIMALVIALSRFAFMH